MTPTEDLRAIVRDRPEQVVFVVGAGVAIGALRGGAYAETASWTGLLKDGLRHAHDFGGVSGADRDAFEQLLRSTNTTSLLSVADAVSQGLYAPSGGEFRRWLRDSVGSFTRGVQERSVLAALAEQQRRGALLVTTNYDHLLEQATGLRATTWRDGPAVERAIRGEEPRVVHLHGEWESPETVVLGTASYLDVARDQHAQAVLMTLRVARTFVFVGCGAGLGDPNIGAFLKKAEQVFATSEYRHFRLAHADEVAKLRPEHPPGQRIFVVSYGTSHAELAPFLRELGPDASDMPVAAASPGAHEAAIAAHRQALLQRVRPMIPIGGALGAASAEDLEALFVEPKLAPPMATRRVEDDVTGPVEEPRDWKQLLPTPGRPAMALLGQIGAGKSTLLRVVTRRLCRDDARVPDHLRGVVPVYVELPAFARSGAAELTEYVVGARTGLDAAALRSLDEAGRLLWILDGLDEVMEPASRAHVEASLTALVEGPSGRLVLVASRPQPAPRISPRFARYVLAPWDEVDVEHLIREYHRTILRAVDAEPRAQRMLAALRGSPALYELCQVPLMLSLVLSIGRSGEIPWPRHRLYSKALEYLLEDWDATKSVVRLAPVSLSLADKLAFVRRLAWTMVSRGQVVLPRGEVDTVAVEFFEQVIREAPAVARRLGPVLVEDLCLRGNLLTVQAGGELAFTHRAWSDYAGALELFARHGELHAVFKARWPEPAWSELLLVAAGLLADRAPGEVAPLLHGVLRSRPSFHLAVLVQPLGFVVRALGYCVHIRQHPLPALGQAITDLLLVIGLGDDAIWPLAAALREAGSAWPDAERLRDGAYSSHEFWLALAVSDLTNRTELLEQCLVGEDEPTYVSSMLRSARRLGRWHDSELRRLLAVRSNGRTDLGPLMTPDAQGLHVAAGLLAIEPCPLAAEYVRAELNSPEPERRAYAALTLLATDAADEGLLAVFAEALSCGIWQQYVPEGIKSDFRRKVTRVARALGEPLRGHLHDVLRSSRSYLARGTAERAFQDAEVAAPDPPERWLHEMLQVEADVPLTEDVIAARLRDLAPELAILPLWHIAESEAVPPASWRVMAKEVRDRCVDPEHRLVVSRLLGDRADVRAVEGGPNKYVTNMRDEVLALAEALDAVLRVGALRRGSVKLAGQRVGRLEELQGGRTRFVYDAGYAGRALAPTMPVRPEAYESDGLHPFFAGLLPQGGMRERKAQAHKLSTSDAFGLLLALERDMPGVVEVVEIQEAWPCHA